MEGKLRMEHKINELIGEKRPFYRHILMLPTYNMEKMDSETVTS